MYQASSEQHRRIISAAARSAVRPPKSMRNLDWRRFLDTYYANVDSSDLAAREPAELAAAALVAPAVRTSEAAIRAGARVQSELARTRIHLAAHHHRDGQ